MAEFTTTDKENGFAILTLSFKEYAEIAALLTAQACNRGAPNNQLGACPEIRMTLDGRTYRVSLTLEPEDRR